MDIATVIVLVALATLVAHIAVAWFFARRGGGNGELKRQISELSKQFDNKIGEQTRTMDNKLTKTVESQFSQSRKLIKNITEEITEVKEASKDVLDITESLEDLEQILTNQKKRGSLGEAGLQLILENLLPPNAFELQYKFANGDRVDAIIQAKDGVIPVDAKFSHSNYQRLLDEDDPEKRENLKKQLKSDLKKRIDETAKYIRPEEETLSFALMYIPAEGLYYDLLVNKVGAAGANPRNLIEYAHEQNVVIVSPTTLAAYLHTILQGLRAFRIEKNAERIQEGIESLRKHLRSYEENHQDLGKHLSAAVNKYDQTNVKLRGIGRDIQQVTDADFSLDGEDVDTPKLE